MNAIELDTAYTALAHAMNAVGEAKTPLLLSMVALALAADHADLAVVLEMIRTAEHAART